MKKQVQLFISVVVILLLLLTSVINPVYAHSIRDIELTISGEACGEGYWGMYAVACVIQNRAKKAHLSPVEIVQYGFMGKDTKRARIGLSDKTSPIPGIVSRLMNNNLPDITHGATHFENVEAFGWPSYDKQRKMIVTCKIGHHTFFKEK